MFSGQTEVRPGQSLPSLIALGAVAWIAWRQGATRALGPWTALFAGAVLVGLVVLATLARARAARVRRSRRERVLGLVDVDGMSGTQFEAFVQQLLERRGFCARRTGCPDDRGVDIVAEGAEACYAVQVKRQRRPVSRRAVSDAVAGMRHYGCTAAMVITNSRFTPSAVALAESNDCALVDREVLEAWIIES